MSYARGLVCYATLTEFQAPIIGGALQHPAERFAIFRGCNFLTTYPYFLPCFVAAVFTACTWVITFFTFREVCEPVFHIVNVAWLTFGLRRLSRPG